MCSHSQCVDVKKQKLQNTKLLIITNFLLAFLVILMLNSQLNNIALQKCLNVSGVPLTTQWDTKGYYYPTQVCQYALAHWSKYVVDSNDKKTAYSETLYEDGAAHQVCIANLNSFQLLGIRISLFGRAHQQKIMPLVIFIVLAEVLLFTVVSCTILFIMLSFILYNFSLFKP